jgi:hypothetical protein
MFGLLASAATLTVAPLHGQETVLRLEEPLARYDEPFSMITGLRELTDGRVMIADALDESLYELDPDLTVATMVGRNGQGPQEYRQPDALFPLAADTTLMTDLGNGRLTVVAPDGSFARTIPISQDRDGGLLIILPAGVDRLGRLYFEPRGDGVLRDSAAVVRWAPEGETTDTVATIKLTDVTETTSGGGNEMRTRVMPVPLSPEDGWAVAPDGRVAVVRAADYSVEWVRPDGVVTRGPATPYDPVPVRVPDKEEWVDGLSNGIMMMVTNENGQMRTSMRRGGMGRRAGPGVDRFEWPEVKPPFDPDGVRVAPDGSLWVRRYVAAGERSTYDIFGADGRRVGRLVLPEGRSLVGFGAGSVYLTRTDDLDFQWLERYSRPQL